MIYCNRALLWRQYLSSCRSPGGCGLLNQGASVKYHKCLDGSEIRCGRMSVQQCPWWGWERLREKAWESLELLACRLVPALLENVKIHLFAATFHSTVECWTCELMAVICWLVWQLIRPCSFDCSSHHLTSYNQKLWAVCRLFMCRKQSVVCMSYRVRKWGRGIDRDK